MSYCFSPNCPQPETAEDSERCQSCGSATRLQNRYIAIRPIGQGGFGRTFLALDFSQSSKAPCVIKQFFPQVQGSRALEEAARLFQQEALQLQKLGSHSQIPELLDHFEQDGHQYLVQEFIDGHNLAEELKESGSFSEAQTLQLLIDLLPVLQFIHQNQVVHRDIKPANIIRRQSDQKLVLVDLGAAKQMTGTAIAKTGTT